MTNLDKVLYPEPGFSKGEVIDYYARIAPVLVPHLRDRALTVVRYPNGVEGKHFFEKRCPTHRPDWVQTATVWAGDRAGEIDFCLAQDRPTLVWLAQLAALEMHPSLARADAVERPTALVFDLDPGEPATIVECCRVAQLVRELFDSLDMECFPKTSGSKGMQVYVPLNGSQTYDVTKPFAQAVAQALEKAHPDLVVSKMTKKLREGKVFVDWSQNTASKTTVAVYSLRARRKPTASTPISWDEVARCQRAGDPEMLVFDSRDILERVEKRGDIFAPVLALEQALPGGNV